MCPLVVPGVLACRHKLWKGVGQFMDLGHQNPYLHIVDMSRIYCLDPGSQEAAVAYLTVQANHIKQENSAFSAQGC